MNFLIISTSFTPVFHKNINISDDIRIGLNNGIISFISNTSSFDREKEGANVTLIVIATDDGSPRKTTETDFIIKIIDINDQMPVFTEVEYRFKVFQVIWRKYIISANLYSFSIIVLV